MKNHILLARRLLLTGFLLVSLGCLEVLAQSGIYVGGHFRRERTHTVGDLKNSGFTYVILFNINVEANGNLTVDGETICANGTYVFGNTSPSYVLDVTSLKTGVTSINRVESCIGGWGNHSYTNIRSLVGAQGTGTGSILYRNFQALKNAIGAIDAINNDDEEAYDVSSATAFHVMLADIGFKTTLAPYMNKPYWQALATNVNNQRSGAVDKVYLQWYEGGAGNNPCDWNLNNIELHTGDLNYAPASTMTSKMISARDNCRSKGGFLWVYNDNNINLPDLAARINSIYGVRPKNNALVATVYRDCSYTGTATSLPVGTYSLIQLQSLGLLNDDVSSLKVSSGYEVVLYENDNFSGAALTVGSVGNSCLVGNALGAGNWNDKTTSLRVRAATASFSQQLEAEAANVNNGMTAEACTEGGQNMGYIDAGDYLVWNAVSIPTSGTYTIEYRVASGGTGGTISADLNAGTTQLGNTTIAGTGGWQTWTTVSKSVTLNAGTYNFGIYAQTGGYNVNWVRITKQGSAREAAATASEAAGLTEVAGAVELYPNPVTDRLQLRTAQTLSGGQYQIRDSFGLVVASGAVAASLDVSALKPGVYTLRLSWPGQAPVSRRFLK